MLPENNLNYNRRKWQLNYFRLQDIVCVCVCNEAGFQKHYIIRCQKYVCHFLKET